MYGNYYSSARPFYVVGGKIVDKVDDFVLEDVEDDDPFAYHVGTTFETHSGVELIVTAISENNVTFQEIGKPVPNVGIIRKDVFYDLISHGCFSMRWDDDEDNG
jgi:hypothetical protein